MGKKKTLHDITGLQAKTPEGMPMPHLFHSHGQLVTHAGGFINKDGAQFQADTYEHRMEGYATVAAGDQMVPYVSENGDVSLRNAVRKAIGNFLAVTSGVLESVIIPAVSMSSPTPYFAAIVALAEHGTSNGKERMKMAQKYLRSTGYRMQARMLPKMCDIITDIAVDGDLEDLEIFYRQFHDIFGREKSQYPGKTTVKVPTLPPPNPQDMHMDAVYLDDGHNNTPWGPMSIKKLSMKKWQHKSVRQKRSIVRSEFGVFKYPWRALPASDYQCFSIKRRNKYGGTVLIDMSGSMSLTAQQIHLLLDHSPCATVAGYGSDSGGGCSSGSLVIIAESFKKGAAHEAREIIGSGNVVDGHALRWLANQDAPRIWISDGHVTGVGDHSSPALFLEAHAICRSAKIVRIPSIEDLIEALKQ